MSECYNLARLLMNLMHLRLHSLDFSSFPLDANRLRKKANTEVILLKGEMLHVKSLASILAPSDGRWSQNSVASKRTSRPRALIDSRQRKTSGRRFHQR